MDWHAFGFFQSSTTQAMSLAGSRSQAEDEVFGTGGRRGRERLLLCPTAVDPRKESQ